MSAARLRGLAALALTALLAPAPLLSAGEKRLSAESACALVQASIRRLARAERNQALALRLTPEGKLTPVVEARLTELRVEIGALRETLRRVNRSAPFGDSSAGHCVDLGFRSLMEAETLSGRIGRLVIREGGKFAAGLPLRPGESPGGEAPLPGRRQPAPGAPRSPE